MPIEYSIRAMALETLVSDGYTFETVRGLFLMLDKIIYNNKAIAYLTIEDRKIVLEAIDSKYIETRRIADDLDRRLKHINIEIR